MKNDVHSVPKKKLLEASDILFGVSRIGLAFGLLTLQAYPSDASFLTKTLSFQANFFPHYIQLNHGVYLVQLI
jgi:hypothetical protein